MKRGYLFYHARLLDPYWKPGPGQRYADAPAALCRVTAVRRGRVYYGIGADATRALGHFPLTDAHNHTIV